MKTISTLFILFVSLNLFAQDPRLFDNQWFLHNLVLNEQNYIPPTNDEIPFVPLNFYSTGELITGICESGGAGLVIFTGTSLFSFDFGLSILTGGCYEDTSNEEYNQLYIYDFWNDTSLEPYHYEILENDSDLILIITNSNGDEAHYGNALLGVQEVFNSSFKIYPNPANDVVHIDKLFNTNIKSIKIIDLNGRMVYYKNQTLNKNTTLNIKNLKSGIYLLFVENENNSIFTKKLIKE